MVRPEKRIPSLRSIIRPGWSPCTKRTLPLRSILYVGLPVVFVITMYQTNSTFKIYYVCRVADGRSDHHVLNELTFKVYYVGRVANGRSDHHVLNELYL